MTEYQPPEPEMRAAFPRSFPTVQSTSMFPPTTSFLEFLQGSGQVVPNNNQNQQFN